MLLAYAGDELVSEVHWPIDTARGESGVYAACASLNIRTVAELKRAYFDATKRVKLDRALGKDSRRIAAVADVVCACEAAVGVIKKPKQEEPQAHAWNREAPPVKRPAQGPSPGTPSPLQVRIAAQPKPQETVMPEVAEIETEETEAGAIPQVPEDYHFHRNGEELRKRMNTVLRHMSEGWTLADCERELGMGRNSLHTFKAKHPVLAELMEQARQMSPIATATATTKPKPKHRAKLVVHHTAVPAKRVKAAPAQKAAPKPEPKAKQAPTHEPQVVVCEPQQATGAAVTVTVTTGKTPAAFVSEWIIREVKRCCGVPTEAWRMLQNNADRFRLLVQMLRDAEEKAANNK